MTIKLTLSQSTLLDLIRGVSAQLVLLGHVLSATGYTGRPTIQDLGVVMFFLLSGFLVTASAMGKPNFGEFFIDRFARMFTPYLPCLLLILLAGLAFNKNGPNTIFAYFSNALMLQDFPLYRYIKFLPEIERISTARPLWSVAMEWWFYMAFGALMYAGKLPRWSWPLVSAGIFVAVFNATVGMLTYTWLLGSLVALTWSAMSARYCRLLFVVSAILVLYRYRIAADEFYDLRLNLLLGVLIFSGLKTVESMQALRWFTPIAAGLAAYSYTLYLTHYTVMALIPGAGMSRVVLVFFVANFVAICLYFAFERHHRILGEAMKFRFLSRAS